MRKTVAASAAVLSLCSVPWPASAATTAAEGYLYARQVLEELTEGCVAPASGGAFVGVGPALSFPAAAATRRILFVSESGAVRTVATGLNAISDCSYDAEADLLYVTDSGQEFSGATTGDTVFAIPGSSNAVAVDGLEVLPAGSIPYAFGIDFTSGGLLVTDAAGGANGRVLAVDLSTPMPSMSTFASGFDYTGGVLVDGDRVLVAESIEPSFESVLSAYSPAGVFQDIVAGPGYDLGSVDLARTRDGDIVASGAPTLVRIDDEGEISPLVTGLDGGTGFDAYGGGVTVNPFTGRIDFLASSFSGADDDKAVHRLVPIDRLLAGGGSAATDCAMEIYGVELVPKSPGMTARLAICTDGDPCDADGVVDGACTYPVGLCLNVADARLPTCTPSGVTSVQLLAAVPASESLAEMVSSIVPSAQAACAFSDGYRVPVRETGSGALRPGKGRIKVRAVTGGLTPKKDTDAVRFVCQPSLP
jgi:hypothetical protein